MANELVKWDYDKSVAWMRPRINKLKANWDEMEPELRKARDALSKTGRPESGTLVPIKTWNDYCVDIGWTRQYVNHLLLSDATHVSHNSGENEWYTPEKYVEAAREVLGEIDLDPASSVEANKVVRASVFFAMTDDGLSKKWAGKVWMNPPYAQPLCGRFCEKLLWHHVAGDVPEAIVLLNNATDTVMVQKLLLAASAVCFPAGRVGFWEPSGQVSHPLQGQLLIYIGSGADGFVASFRKFGVASEWKAQ